MEVRHLTARFAWHDSDWNGKICRNPSDNIYCRGNHSLLSARIQRRINLEIENEYKEKPLGEVIRSKGYSPPCYWCINAFGKEKCMVIDPHPFSDLEWAKEDFESVEPLQEEIDKHSIFTWCFKLSFAEEGSPEGRYPSDLEERVEKYLNKIIPGKSLVFFYANYSNPITGDDYERLLLGAALVKEVKPPKRYRFPSDLLEDIRKGKGMQNFPEIAWQFRIKLDHETAFVLPYNMYLKWIDEAKDDREKDRRMRLLSEVAIPIDEPTLQPAFKYVSMQLSHDQALYLVYLLKRSWKRMKEHGYIPRDILNDISQKIEKILSELWKQRGKYPGFRNAVKVLLKHDFGEKSEEIAEKVEELIIDRFGDISRYLEKSEKIEVDNHMVKRALDKLEKEKEKLAFISLFDFSVLQMERVLEIIDRKGLRTVKTNPYLLVEEYTYDQKEDWLLDQSDPGIDVYNIDMALIPDPNFADWYFEGFDATSPFRIRAVISKILLETALFTGDTYLTRGEILEEIKDYPLYYIGEDLQIEESKLRDYEALQTFKEKFILNTEPETGETIYQLKSIRTVEDTIEKFVKTMLKKQYSVSPDDEDFIQEAIKDDLSRAQIKVDEDSLKKERETLYRNAFEKGLFIVSGRAGTGKTQAIVNLIKYFREKGKGRIFVFSPTGKSNLVIRNRLRDLGLHNDPMVKVSTIHRFLYGGLIDAMREAGISINKYFADIKKLNDFITKILDGKIDMFVEFQKLAAKWKFNPSVVILDEASMVDETTFAVLLSMINEQSLKHLILVGDEKQLPPIGTGRPFSDIIFFLKKEGYEKNIVYLKNNLRFLPDSAIGGLSSIFAEDEKPTIQELERFCVQKDDTMEIIRFKELEDLKKTLQKILSEISGKDSSGRSLFELFKEVFEDGENIEYVQILTPRRVGEFGSWGLNLKAVMEGRSGILPGSKLICEENIYIDVEKAGRKQRVLGLANGSMGYLKENRYFEFREIKEIYQEYGKSGGYQIVEKIRQDIENPLKTDRSIDLAYAITVHKSQGSDFDYVILVLKDVTSFVTRELIYTALTRAKKKLYLLIHEDLAEELPAILWEIYENSATEKIKTMLFNAKRSPFRPYLLELRDGRKITVRSKIEYVIAKTLDGLGIEFEYEPEDFRDKGIYPDFRISIDGEIYYWEHLGRLDDLSYRERWIRKLGIYRNLGLEDKLITTTESERVSSIENAVQQIIEDLKKRRPRTTEDGYPSKHHYEL